MFEAGQTLTGTGVRLGMNAEGVLRPGGKVLFVPGLLPGEEAEVRVDTVQKRFAFGSIVHLVSESEDRVSPPCAFYGECGGCSCQHMRYEAQLEFKQGQVDDCLRRVGGLDAGVENAVGMDNPWRYRNKTRYQVGAS
ncbi:MAG: class I SAM-dependent RNA methyltransferase, partial [Clostridiales bacterium]|nr:class I SAM-dependent RNA methyltransferase [Clostridiales bacterium]